MSNRTLYRGLLAGVAVLTVAGLGAASFAKDKWESGGWRHGGHMGAHFGGRHGPRFGGGHGPARHMFHYLDVNEDGAVGKPEAAEVIDAKLEAFDGDSDEALSLQEFEGLWLDFTRNRMVDGFQALDEDGDGQITRAEITKPLERVFRFADRNEDGVIDRKDRRGRHGPGRHGGDREDGDRGE